MISPLIIPSLGVFYLVFQSFQPGVDFNQMLISYLIVGAVWTLIELILLDPKKISDEEWDTVKSDSGLVACLIVMVLWLPILFTVLLKKRE